MKYTGFSKTFLRNLSGSHRTSWHIHYWQS